MDGLTEKQELEEQIEDKLAYVLANIYLKIPWTKIGVKSSHRFFIDRIRASNGAENIRQFIDRLCKKVSVNFVKIDTEYIDFLEENRAYCFKLLRQETQYIALLSLETVDYLRDIKKQKKGE